ncbi:MAG: hypothetical protein ACTHQ3_21010 [Motilibacteraceae bacterium]
MRWEDLFADLEAQLAQAERAELAGEVADRSRRELARIRLVDRLRAVVDRPVELSVRGAGRLGGRLTDVAPEWLLVEERIGVSTLVPLAAVLAVCGLGARAEDPTGEGAVAARLGLGVALRALARDRAPVSLVLVDGGVLSGTIDRVGADHLDLAEHAPGELRRAREVRGVSTVPFAAVGAVRPAL